MGVSTHLPSSFHYWSGTGISGVNPLSIVLENSDPETIEMKPHWLQDTFDQTCLGPMGGFSECGDATLWLVIPKQKRHARRRQWIRWATEDPEGDNEAQQKPQGYALQVVDDVNNYLQNRDSAEREGAGNTTPTDYSQKECLTRRSKDNKLVLAPCSQERSWAWQFNEHGILHFEKKSSKQSNRNHKRALLKKQRTLEQCLWRNASEAVLMSCDGEASQVNLTSDVEERVVQIALVRQATATLSESEPDDSPSTGKASSKGRSDPSSNKRPKDAFSNLPHQGGIAHSHASDPVVHSEPKQASRLTSLSRQKASQSGTGTAKLPVRFLKDTNPILLAGGRQLERNAFSDATPRMDSSSPKSILHETTPSSMKPKIRKIQVNPYIAASNDERWKDPLTGLVYRTDLCQYLGHERAEVGRHTLVGVGQFMKTVFNIKVSTQIVKENRWPVLTTLWITNFPNNAYLFPGLWCRTLRFQA